MSTLPLVTFGHSTADHLELTALLRAAHIASVVDIRTAPGSRHNPDAGRERLQRWLPAAGIAYRWERRLGGFRPVLPDSPDTIWRNASFRGYAGYTRDPAFLAAVDQLLQDARTTATAIMCGEALWWRCHRRIIADFAVLVRHYPVLHLMHDGRMVRHTATPGVRLREDGLLVYDDTAAAGRRP
ncbi:DUF488 domain-containing protein [Streptomyces scopuliridis]|uniref:DUF488 domain-containing protein n=1 Tax=Streptomyces scopuliridis TaxID=452529 RepID=A0ACD4ZE85_9ACTN|nr:DUF488 domain-containing protein [Streptomyces scopuliridis]WSB32528.1 DUF488 domain-containing protein [Streptomyces scopuliridis]WSB96774.1 DUF488 domain-containing protein [Streptomyces scopuliridis]WSC09522.1 DUF488 domain-containing protein [Streptomyces scopuliridis]